MDVRSLRYAVTLADELHFGRAAAAHYISPQPFGRRIRELERAIGARLFDRTSRRVDLTPAGERFLPRARAVLADLDALTERLADPRDGSELRVGVVGYGLAERWPATRSLLARSYPWLTLRFVELDWSTQYDAVRTGEVDVAIVHHLGEDDDLAVEELATSARHVVVPVDSELADAEKLQESDLADRSWITPVGHPGLAAWTGPGEVDRRVVVRSPANVAAAVAATGRLALHAETASRFFPHSGVRYVPTGGPDGVAALAWCRRTRTAAVEAFRSAAHGSAAIGALGDGIRDR
ncbi:MULTISPECIES: LysR family transcriptional regulator [Pseudonocardia]|uniref:Hca operon transcriptional activator n=2 Tax=Pseudonocardia TaxID=1847 RepID=A0A1Y2N055_PSEAH|nr:MULTISPECIES: LysR family transcriptional regulator [Pseudonocardia]OSY40843.1 Hca operon transcriptional activator [Pseudonocardia autotrophica]TDN71849.1 LysR family transcriptional regulator [Pseudonocardia autotrophica]BBG02537.1 LysR family transcriptional regulator [Pseudonocardia autotrophica]GEC29300.1 LysR family transcriptional regulator [Pseudonocardia saturnea]